MRSISTKGYSFRKSDEYPMVADIISNPKYIAAALEANAKGKPPMSVYVDPINALFSEANPPTEGFNSQVVHMLIGKMIGKIFYERGYNPSLNEASVKIEPYDGKYFTPKTATRFRRTEDE